MKYIVGLANTWNAFKLGFPRILPGAGRRDITFGYPLFEDSSAAQRRFCVAFAFTPEELAWLEARMPAAWDVVDALPADWRYPPPEWL